MVKPLRVSVPALLLLFSLLPALACDEGRPPNGSPVGPSSPVSPVPDFSFPSLSQQVEVVSGDGQMAQPGSLLAPLVVRVTDNSGVPVENAAVFWRILSGDPTLAPMGNAAGDGDAKTFTDSTGLTDVRITLGPEPDTHRIEAKSISTRRGLTIVSNQVIFEATGS